MEVSGQLYCQGKSPWYPSDRRLGGPQSQFECNGEERFPARAYYLSLREKVGGCGIQGLSGSLRRFDGFILTQIVQTHT